ncbi:MAG: AAA family ATPase [Nocardioidaceae bacterium]
MSKRYVVTGAPGAGKTALLHALKARHWSVVEEAATDVIADEQAGGCDEPWSSHDFTGRVAALQRQRQLTAPEADVQLYDRSPWCTLALARFLGHPVPLALSREIARVAANAVYERTVIFVRLLGFVEPTAARRISYADCLVFEALHEAVYRNHGFTLLDVEPGSVDARAAAVEAQLARESSRVADHRQPHPSAPAPGKTPANPQTNPAGAGAHPNGTPGRGRGPRLPDSSHGPGW